MTTAATPADLVAFWREAGFDRWFTADPAFDGACRAYLPLHEAAARGALASWDETPEGALALVLLLDQFPRNLFRGTPRAWATDAQALAVAERALARGHDRAIEPALRIFLYMPLTHAEDLGLQERSVALFTALGLPVHREAAIEHRDLIRRFGRFPHRNAVLGRPETAAERDYLAREDAFRG
ncbi:DUF924 domain-containing protein [Methylobacterium currus]|uniref:DUF924 domain-containing protein n=1 Tax=Methylobacterium currus TaxID=2051553 RepID=A0A2R4WVH5_9HYPH|nr:DUF924 family protein [Methylobacterium currus]AWB25538.1 DUF924 domain-containing protein [Methylobacterium currus]UHC19663.1 DUF924 domain-containing protein [Methylobacterium currus]